MSHVIYNKYGIDTVRKLKDVIMNSDDHQNTTNFHDSIRIGLNVLYVREAMSVKHVLRELRVKFTW